MEGGGVECALVATCLSLAPTIEDWLGRVTLVHDASPRTTVTGFSALLLFLGLAAIRCSPQYSKYTFCLKNGI